MSPRNLNNLSDDQLRALVLKKKKQMKYELPHLYGWKWYRWARAFFESRNPMSLLVAANQISKSTTQIRKCIHWATHTPMWPELWPNHPIPQQFWYLYPTSDIATTEFHTKWAPEIMPKRGAFIKERYKEQCDDPLYGWKANYDKKKIHSIDFQSGLTLYFKTYAQNVHALQAGTVHALFCFTAGHLVCTSKGLKPIENMQLGDMVATTDGFRCVTAKMSRMADVVTRLPGVKATPNHLFYTDEGWVPYNELHEEHTIKRMRLWTLLEKLYFLRGSFTQDTRIQRIAEKGITFVGARIAGLASFMWRCGNLITKEEFLRDSLYTIRTLTRWTIELRIWKFSHAPSIQEFINSTSGRDGRTQDSTLVINVVETSFLELRREKSLSFALKNAVKMLTVTILDVLLVLQNLVLVKTQRPELVPQPAPRNTKKERVYDISVEGSKEFVTNGYHVHNCDEELPEELFDELNFRKRAVDGYFHMVFTATRNQLLWLLTMEGEGEMEKFPNAFKLNVSMYDCQVYEDGSPGHFPLSKIKEAEGDCKSDTEIQRRVMGRFVTEVGRKYPTFDPKRHFVKPFKTPVAEGWRFYGGADPGSGGAGGHPTGLGIIAVSPDYRRGYVIRGWRGDNVETTAGDALDKYIELKGDLPITLQVYDWAAKDFYTIGLRIGETFIKAEKSHELGEQVVNTLFKNNMLFIFDTPELRKLGIELMTLNRDTPKKNAKDDFIDGAVRYPATSIPWDFTAIRKEPSEAELLEKKKKAEIWTEEKELEWQIQQRRGDTLKKPPGEGEWADVNAEIAMWNERYGN